MRKGKFRESAPPSKAEPGRQGEVPSTPSKLRNLCTRRGCSRAPLRRLAQQNWKNLHHLSYSTHLSIGTSSHKNLAISVLLSFVAGQVFEYWLLAADQWEPITERFHLARAWERKIAAPRL
jgi:hypothetical protein